MSEKLLKTEVGPPYNVATWLSMLATFRCPIDYMPSNCTAENEKGLIFQAFVDTIE